jgi:hypothetical protein
MSSKKSCGPHVELTSNPAVRVTRCACGTLHVHLKASGVSLQLEEEQLRHVSNGLAGAARLLDAAEAAPVVTKSSGDGTVH